MTNKTALFVDGGFYRKRASNLWGKKTPEKRAAELYAYCSDHLRHEQNYSKERTLYRIFYYDCPPISKTVYHPLLQRGIDFRHKDTYQWTLDFFDCLREQRKVAIRLGELSDNRASFVLRPDKLKQLLAGKILIGDLTEDDFDISFEQKGVDMRIGVDIASVTFKHQVDQIILISGDSDFVPAAKLARREGIDFVLDPMFSNIKASLNEHIDGLRSNWAKSKVNKNAKAPSDT
ncbi:MAG: NYN domain-containing protein [Eubacteriales bacterium]|nr:NYN domain-containing protein [Eubacteriales bacterium]